ncbi:VIT family-domain-containing protein [Triangularia verruculosa]|uniref:VIT family-domain-containing protein n=1 Tax=Triangularia verruculosa TaxID=2587418 RepID=A0AAN7ASF9_9PEZI|nr:VIT family-domain-containing protein [Triangularia verruculosa]
MSRPQPSLSQKLSRIIRGDPPTASQDNLPVYESIPISPSPHKQSLSINRFSDSSSSSITATDLPELITPSPTMSPSIFTTSWSYPVITLTSFLSNFTLGFADGLTVPFALTAGLSSLGNTRTVIYAGMAEICAGSISMGIGGYLAARPSSTAASSTSEEVEEGEKEEASSSDGLLSPCRRCQDSGESDEEVKESPIVAGLAVSVGYLLGGILPLFPYFFVGVENVHVGLAWSFGVCVVALFVFGFVKDFILTRNDKGADGENVRRKRLRKAVWEGVQMALLGSVAAVAAVLCVKAFEGLV